MSNKEFYKVLGIKKGDQITQSQLAQMNQMRRQRAAGEKVTAPKVDPIPDANLETNSDPVAVDDESIVAAVKLLDPENKEHWTTKGQPQMSAIEDILGTKDVTRKDIERLMPDYDIDKAKG